MLDRNKRFAREINVLTEEPPDLSYSCLNFPYPVLDKEWILLRIGGCLSNADISYNQIFAILIAKNDKKDQKLCHGEVQTVLPSIRLRYSRPINK